MSPIRVISLERKPASRAAFQQRNGHVPFEFFDAVDGSALSLDDIRRSGLFTAEVESTYDAHSYGCALSHWHLWKEAAAARAPLTIAEDDVVFRLDFEARAQQLLDALPSGWDMVLWGWNFNSMLHVHPMGASSSVAMLFEQDRLRDSLDEFQALRVPVQPFPLEKAFGLPAYTLSPQGAAKFLRLCFPQRPLKVWIPVFDRFQGNVGVDIATTAVYAQTASFACFPPLAASPNWDARVK